MRGRQISAAWERSGDSQNDWRQRISTRPRAGPYPETQSGRQACANWLMLVGDDRPLQADLMRFRLALSITGQAVSRNPGAPAPTECAPPKSPAVRPSPVSTGWSLPAGTRWLQRAFLLKLCTFVQGTASQRAGRVGTVRSRKSLRVATRHLTCFTSSTARGSRGKALRNSATANLRLRRP